MNRDQFTLYASALIRHLLTLGAGFLAARGFTNSGDMVSNLSAAAALFIATVAWSFIQKHKLLAALVAAIQLDPTVVQPPSAAAPSAAAPAPAVQPPLGSPPQEPDASSGTAEIPLTEEVTQP